MPISPKQPFDDIQLDEEKIQFLKKLQANILRGHGREHVALLFLKINDVKDAKTFLHDYPISNAYDQHLEVENFKKTGVPGNIVYLAFLSKAGLEKLGHAGKVISDPPFNTGVRSDPAVLDKGTTSSWQAELLEESHVLLLLAYHDETVLARTVGNYVADFGRDASPFELVYVQSGRGYKNADSEGVEHFGYVDGRSQPLLLNSQIAAEKAARRGGTDKYDPSTALSQVLVDDPLSSSAFGSFFVFRKLEQNVAGFKAREEALGELLGLQGADEERAGAQVVGRFEDGTSLVQSPDPEGAPVTNNFNYDADPEGSKCPFHSHIRKTHPRGSSPGGLEFDKGVQMARRGITYGTRLQHPDTKAFIDQPRDGVGLLFMSYQASIKDQFHFMQTAWANNPNFPSANVGIDPIIGQGPSNDHHWFPQYGSAANAKALLFEGFVTLKGSEYFFAPSVSGLKTI